MTEKKQKVLLLVYSFSILFPTCFLKLQNTETLQFSRKLRRQNIKTHKRKEAKWVLKSVPEIIYLLFLTFSSHMSEYLFTSESVSEGHPDKVADQISDAILDAILTEDPRARVAAETLVNTGLCVLAGEITTTANIDYIGIARKVITDIGYNSSDLCYDGNTLAVMVCYDKQSPDIAQ